MYAPEARAQRRAPVCWVQTKKMMRENKRVRPDACVHEDRIWSGCYVATSFRPRRRRGPAAEARRYRTLSTYTHTKEFLQNLLAERDQFQKEFDERVAMRRNEQAATQAALDFFL